MKKVLLVFLLLWLFSCWNSQKEVENEVVENTSSEELLITSTWEELIPKNETTTPVEEEFSRDLNNLFNLIDETDAK